MDSAVPQGREHHDTFELDALDTRLDLAADATRADAMNAMDGHILGAAVFVALFHWQDAKECAQRLRFCHNRAGVTRKGIGSPA